MLYDGIIFLREKVINKELILESCEYEAVGYLIPKDEIWSKLNPDSIGLCIPDVRNLIPKELLNNKYKTDVGILFRTNDRAINANQLEHINNWKVEKINDRIWGIKYVEKGNTIPS